MHGITASLQRRLTLPDFLTHLERRLGTSREIALNVLGNWLATYEPVTRRVIDAAGTAGPMAG